MNDQPTEDQTAALPAHIEVFSFDPPEAIIEAQDYLDMFETYGNGRWYEPPFPYARSARLFDASSHHSSAIQVKRNILLSTFVPHPLLDASSFSQLVLDFLIFGDAFVELRRSISRQPLKLRPSLAMYTRVGVEPGSHWFVHNMREPYEFARDAVFHFREPDIRQEVYGRPQYLSAMTSLLLSNSATTYRQRYYTNGSHAGFILYVTASGMAPGEVEKIKTGLRESRGRGNFRNFFIHSAGGTPDGVKVIPLSELGNKDDFNFVKRISRDEILAAHRVPPQLLGIVPDNAGGFGKASEAAEVFVANELLTLQRIFEQLNDFVGQRVVQFRPYAIGQAKA